MPSRISYLLERGIFKTKCTVWVCKKSHSLPLVCLVLFCKNLTRLPGKSASNEKILPVMGVIFCLCSEQQTKAYHTTCIYDLWFLVHMRRHFSDKRQIRLQNWYPYRAKYIQVYDLYEINHQENWNFIDCNGSTKNLSSEDKRGRWIACNEKMITFDE